MFELPGAKRVKRSKLFSSFSSSEDESESQVKAPSSPEADTVKDSRTSNVSGSKARRSTSILKSLIDYGFDYEFVDKTEPQAALEQKSTNQSGPKLSFPIDSNEAPTEPEEQSYAFNLFAPKPHTQPTITEASPLGPEPSNTRITIRSPTPTPLSTDLTTSRIIKPRPLSYYLTGSLPTSTLEDLKSQYLNTAISGSSISQLSQQSWPGTHLPWRIIRIAPERLTVRGPADTSSPGSVRRERTRPSKKRRILVRRRIAAREALKVASVRDEEAEREKRTKRNREKKVKRKLREKAKKAAAAATAVAVEGGVVGEEDAGIDDDSE